MEVPVNNCTPFGVTADAVIQLPQTGQTTVYAFRDDGDFHAGVPFPVPRFTVNNPDGTVKDNLTGLIWLQDANCLSGTRNWADALTFAVNLADSQCGLTDGSTAADWRLPNVRELHSLIHYEFVAPALSDTAGDAVWDTDDDPFENVQSEDYWTSTTVAENSTIAWFVAFGNGLISNAGKDQGKFVLPVRGP